MALTYDTENQKQLIQLMLADGFVFSKCVYALKPEYFDKQFHSTIKYLVDFSWKYNSIPLIEQINLECRQDFIRLPIDISEDKGSQNSIIDSVDTYIKIKAMENAILESSECIAKGDRETPLTLVREALRVGIKKGIGIDFWSDQKEWLQKTHNEVGNISTGLVNFDEYLGGGFGYGQYVLVVAESGGGKSVTLANLAISLSLRKHNVVYYTFEMGEELVGKRISAMHTKTPFKQIYFKEDEVIKEICESYQKLNPGNFRIKNMARGSTITDIDMSTREIELQTGKPIDIVILDYSDLMSSRDKRIDPNNISLTGKYIAEEVRSWAKDDRTESQGLPTLVIGASQVDKASQGEEDVGNKNVQGSIWKVNTADVIFMVHATPANKQNGEYNIKFLKTRNANATGKKLKIKYDPDTMAMSDPVLIVEEKKKSASDVFMSKKNDVPANNAIISNAPPDSQEPKLSAEQKRGAIADNFETDEQI